eukprot:2095368-Rhodomonas_salina.2
MSQGLYTTHPDDALIDSRAYSTTSRDEIWPSVVVTGFRSLHCSAENPSGLGGVWVLLDGNTMPLALALAQQLRHTAQHRENRTQLSSTRGSRAPSTHTLASLEPRPDFLAVRPTTS